MEYVLSFPNKINICEKLENNLYVSVANKWMHEIGQEFRRPCQLKQVIDNNDYSMYNTIKI